jgi:hypothetical protein
MSFVALYPFIILIQAILPLRSTGPDEEARIRAESSWIRI